MKIFSKVCLSFLFASTVFVFAHAQENQTYIIHTIQKGQSLYSISNMYGTTVDAIVKLNPGSDQVIVEGKQLKIPRPDTVTDTGTFHTIQQGETLYGLAQKYKVTVKSIIDANPGLNEKNFRFGQVVSIPKSNPATASATTLAPQVQAEQTEEPKAQQGIPGPVQSRCKEMHKVERKETVYSIARKYGITEQELLDATALRAEKAAEHHFQMTQASAQELFTKLEALNPIAVMNRGFAHVSTADQKNLTSVNDVSVGDAVTIRLKDGELSATVTGKS